MLFKLPNPGPVSGKRPTEGRRSGDALALAAAGGDRQALEELLRRLAPSVLRITRALFGVTAEQVDDAAQESLIAFVRALPTYRGDGSVERFCARITIRTALAMKRRRKNEADRVPEIADESDPSSAVYTRELFRAVLDELPLEQAETLVLRFVMGHSLDQVAAATGVPVNTVRSRVRLAKNALRKRIREDAALAEMLGIET